MTVDAGGPSPQLTCPYTTPWDSTAGAVPSLPGRVRRPGRVTRRLVLARSPRCAAAFSRLPGRRHPIYCEAYRPSLRNKAPLAPSALSWS
jgi:hypothetical protein